MKIIRNYSLNENHARHILHENNKLEEIKSIIANGDSDEIADWLMSDWDMPVHDLVGDILNKNGYTEYFSEGSLQSADYGYLYVEAVKDGQVYSGYCNWEELFNKQIDIIRNAKSLKSAMVAYAKYEAAAALKVMEPKEDDESDQIDPKNKLTHVTIPDGVTSIEYSYLKPYRDYVESITIPTSVTKIGEAAFYGCEKLSNIVIPETVTNIGKQAFEYCTNLTSVKIPNKVTAIESSAFQRCENLTKAIIGDSVDNIGLCAFADCHNLSSITFGKNVTSIDNTAFAGCESLTELTLPDNLTSIGNYAFSRCKSLVRVIIPSSVTNIGDTAFELCPKLTLYVFKGTEGERYAKQNNIPFRYI